MQYRGKNTKASEQEAGSEQLGYQPNQIAPPYIGGLMGTKKEPGASGKSGHYQAGSEEVFLARYTGSMEKIIRIPRCQNPQCTEQSAHTQGMQADF